MEVFTELLDYIPVLGGGANVTSVSSAALWMGTIVNKLSTWTPVEPLAEFGQTSWQSAVRSGETAR